MVSDSGASECTCNTGTIYVSYSESLLTWKCSLVLTCHKNDCNEKLLNLCYTEKFSEQAILTIDVLNKVHPVRR